MAMDQPETQGGSAVRAGAHDLVSSSCLLSAKPFFSTTHVTKPQNPPTCSPHPANPSFLLRLVFASSRSHQAPKHRSDMPPALPATTSARAKASFQKNGPRLTEREIKRIERDAVLFRRAEELKERDANRKRAKEKARLKEARERESRRKTGLGLATQLVGFSHSQGRMKVGTFSYRRVGKFCLSVRVEC